MDVASVIHSFGLDRMLDESALRAIASASRIRRLAKNEALISLGELNYDVSFLISGIMRSYLVDIDGNEITDCFVFHPGTVVVPCARLDVPSPTTVMAEVPSSVLSISSECVSSLLSTNNSAMKLYVELLQRAWEWHWHSRLVFNRRTAKERYLWFLRVFPGLVDHVPNHHIASFLGMTPVTLSRLRSSMRAEEAGE